MMSGHDSGIPELSESTFRLGPARHCRPIRSAGAAPSRYNCFRVVTLARKPIAGRIGPSPRQGGRHVGATRSGRWERVHVESVRVRRCACASGSGRGERDGDECTGPGCARVVVVAGGRGGEKEGSSGPLLVGFRGVRVGGEDSDGGVRVGGEDRLEEGHAVLQGILRPSA